MEDIGETPTGSQKEQEILEKTPLLKAFLADISDRKVWGDRLQAEYLKVEQEMKKRLGDDYSIIGNGPLTIMLNDNDIFETGLPLKSKNGFANMLTAIGYQIGDFEKVSMFLEDVCVQGTNAHILGKVKSDRQSERTVDSVWTTLRSGVYWRHWVDGNVPPEFESYINTLNF